MAQAQVESLNFATYREKRIVDWYVTVDLLLPAEAAIFEQFAHAFRDKKVLDIGVGGGRSTVHISRLTRDYVGVDYSPEMVEGCRRRFPDLPFMQCDARDLAPFEDASFDVVFFSWNGIDTVDHEGRMRVFKQAYRVLKPGGYFVFSSHNRHFRGQELWVEPTRNPLRLGARYLRYYQGKVRHLIRRRHEVRTEEYCILNDPAHEHRQLHYYTAPDMQAAQLKRHGFETEAMFGADGKPLPQMVCPDFEYVYYCARKSQ